MGKADFLEVVYKEHNTFIKIINSFGEYDYAEDLVQEAYLVLYKYAKPENIIDNNKVNMGYMFFTLRSVMYQYYNKKKKIKKVSLDDENNNIDLKQSNNIEEEEAFNKLCLLIDQELDSWHWYDKKLFKLYRDTDLSIRGLSKETGISFVSIFHTLKDCKNKIKDKFKEDYIDYKNKDYERI